MRERLGRAKGRRPRTRYQWLLEIPPAPNAPPPSILKFFRQVALDCSISIRELTTPGKGRAEVTKARRHISIELRAAGLSYTTIGDYLGVDRASIHHLVNNPARERTDEQRVNEPSGERQKQEREYLNLWINKELPEMDLSGEWAI